MMKQIALMTTLMLAACDGPPPGETRTEAPPSPPREIFSFRGLGASLDLAGAQKTGIVRDCLDISNKGRQTVACDLDYPAVGDVEAIEGRVFFENARFDFITLQIVPERVDRMIKPLTDAYGKPCRRETSTLSNYMGATIPNEAFVWCFRDGELILSRHDTDEDLTRALLEFHRDRPEKPRPTFTADKL